MHRRLLALCAAGALMGLGGCGETRVSASKVEKAIKQGVERDNPGTKVAAVKCPKGRKAKKGDTFTCQVMGSMASQRATATVVQLNDKGNVRYSVR